MTDDDGLTEYPDEVPNVGIERVLRGLPLCDAYLGMQALNLDLVDSFLERQEAQLLAEYMKEERTPFPAVVFVSALSQMWVFALYELLRTWRQRANTVLKDDRTAECNEARTSLQRAIDRTERLFRRIEALRVYLAKHELPRARGSHAMAPGYGRIDMLTGSIYWLVELRGDEVDLVSRRTLADECRRLALDRDVSILPGALQEKVKKLSEHSYGVKRIAVVLDDETKYAGVYIGWNKEVLMVEGHDASVPFDVNRVVEVQPDTLSC